MLDAEARCKGKCVVESGVRVGVEIVSFLAWQVFHLEVGGGEGSSCLRASLLDLMLMSYWVQCLTPSERPDSQVELKCVFASSSASDETKVLALPEWMSSSVWTNRRECSRTGPWDRFAVGQLIFLATWRKHMLAATAHSRPLYGLPS